MFSGYFLFSRGGGYQHHQRNIILLGLIWSLAQVISDIANGIDFHTSMKGVFSPLFLSFTLCGLINYFTRVNSFYPIFIMGFIVGEFINLLIYPTTFFVDDPWKWGLGNFIFYFFIAFNCFLQQEKKNQTLILFIVFFCIYCVTTGSRSMGILPVLALLFYGATRIFNFRKFLGENYCGIKILLVAIPLIIVINLSLSTLFKSEFLLSSIPESISEKYKIQASGEYGLLLGARSESLISLEAFLDKPFWGHGSWAKDDGYYAKKYQYLRELAGSSLGDDVEQIDEGGVLIPTHSYLIGALVWAGIFGGIYWGYLYMLVTDKFINNLDILPPFFYFGYLGLIWGILFSPLGSGGRWHTAMFIAALLAYPKNYENNNSYPII